MDGVRRNGRVQIQQPVPCQRTIRSEYWKKNDWHRAEKNPLFTRVGDLVIGFGGPSTGTAGGKPKKPSLHARPIRLF